MKIVLYTIIIILCFIFLCYKKSIIQFHKSLTINLDKKIVELREKYKNMLDDNRITTDICKNSDKLGAAREKYYFREGNNCEPWIARECIFVLDHILPFNGSGLEWSSGSSTLWLSYRLRRIVAIENLKRWYKDVKRIISKTNTKQNIKLLWFDKDNLSYCNAENLYITYAYGRKTCLKTYASNNIIPRIVYDFISIDGRVRTACFLRAINMVKKENGIILFDNAQRENYRWVFKKVPSQWSRFNFWYNNSLTSMFITHIY